MFPNVGWTEMLLIAVVALVVLGPERLPEAARWIAGAVKRVKDYAGSAQQQLKDDFGTDFEDFREPLKQINELRGMTPRAIVTKLLLDGDDSLFTSAFDAAAPATTPDPQARPAQAPRPQQQSAPAPTPPAGGGGSAGTPQATPPAAGATPSWDDVL